MDIATIVFALATAATPAANTAATAGGAAGVQSPPPHAEAVAPAPSGAGASSVHGASLADIDLADLVRAEGLPAPSTNTGIMQPYELDDDPTTREALVMVFSPEHCSMSGCTTLVIQRTADGKTKPVGHGRMLGVVAQRSNGWLELAEPDLSRPGFFTYQRWRNGRYRPETPDAALQTTVRRPGVDRPAALQPAVPKTAAKPPAEVPVDAPGARGKSAPTCRHDSGESTSRWQRSGGPRRARVRLWLRASEGNTTTR